MFRSTTFDDFYASPFGESWYLDRPVLVALVVSLVLHAVAIALLPGMRVPKPEDKPLTVKLVPLPKEPPPPEISKPKATQQKPDAPARPKAAPRAAC